MATGLLLGGCGGGAGVDLMAGSSPEAARALLAQMAREGPVLLQTFDGRLDASSDTAQGIDGLSADALRQAAEDGVEGLTVRFTADPASAVAGGRLVLAEGVEGPSICAADPTGVSGGLRAGFCTGERALAAVRLPAEEGPLTERRVWRVMRRLFPDDYPSAYGFGWLGNRISIGIGLGF
ncbi:MAG: hypothetical protein KDE35_08035 [Geminicoccaceae bacterium]|nr:hypothetical protein [Geminicoccaceae bacterium]